MEQNIPKFGEVPLSFFLKETVNKETKIEINFVFIRQLLWESLNITTYTPQYYSEEFSLKSYH